MEMLTTTKALEVLRSNGVKVSYPTIALWVREGKFAGAMLEETPRGPVWRIPRASIDSFKQPPRGRPAKASAPAPTRRAARGRITK